MTFVSADRLARNRGAAKSRKLLILSGIRPRLACGTDAQVVEIVAIVAENVFTNFLNVVARTEIDFPVVRHAKAA
jgi:hypothetical protein